MADAPRFAGSASELRHHRLPRTAPVAGVYPWLTYTNTDPFCALIREGKFNDRPELIEELACLYSRWLETSGCLDGVDLIVPVPMHWLKRLIRGYNQAELIAAAVGRRCGIPVERALRAVRRHAVQSRRSGTERARNVKGIFELSPCCDIKNRNIAIADDILTTGATLSEAVNTLMLGQPASVTVLALAAVAH